MSQAGFINITSQPIINPNQPIFSAWVSAAQTGVTGNGTAATIIFDAVLVNQKSGYDHTTGIFTAPITGNYFFSYNIMGIGFIASNDTGRGQLLINSLVYQGQRNNPKNIYDASSITSYNGTVLVPLTSGQTAQVQFAVGGNATKNINIQQDGTNPYTIFCGYLVG